MTKILGVLSCTSAKMRKAAPAWMLYSASPVFARALLLASQETTCQVVLSARHGLVELDTVLEPYEQKMRRSDDLKASTAKLRAAVENGWRLYSYCGDLYNRVFAELPYERRTSGNMFNSSIPQTIKGEYLAPTALLVLWAYRLGRPFSVEELEAFIATRWDHPVTRKCQRDRLLKSPVIAEAAAGMYQYVPVAVA